MSSEYHIVPRPRRSILDMTMLRSKRKAFLRLAHVKAMKHVGNVVPRFSLNEKQSIVKVEAGSEVPRSLVGPLDAKGMREYIQQHITEWEVPL